MTWLLEGEDLQAVLEEIRYAPHCAPDLWGLPWLSMQVQSVLEGSLGMSATVAALQSVAGVSLGCGCHLLRGLLTLWTVLRLQQWSPVP